jgi:hypothetical protein
MRYYLRLAHSGSLEQRQARHCHSCDLHPWDHRCVTEKSVSCAHLEPLIAAAAGYGLASGLLSTFPEDSNLTLGKLDIIMIGPTLGTNLLSTALIAWKAWCAYLASDPSWLSLTMSPV